MRVLLVHCDHRPFERERFGAAWARAGGDPAELVAVTPALAAAEPRWNDNDVFGVLLTGGPDVAPARYGAEPEPGLELTNDAARDALDLTLLGLADERGWPVLAVCYGCQILNVFHGGTLIQDLARAGRPGHQVSEPKEFLAHTVRRCGRSRWLGELPEELAVNSRHHQAIDRLAPTLEATAVAPDGVIEAVEQRDADRFVVGIQWHPENLTQQEHVAIFRAFRAACLNVSMSFPVPRFPSPVPSLRP